MDNFITEYSKQNIDIKSFADIILNDNNKRELMMSEMLTNNNIMVYFNGYLIIAEASEALPELFYTHFEDIAKLLSHKNSYHRNIALHLLANMASIDKDNKFDKVIDSYYKTLSDIKFQTKLYCIKHSAKIIRARNDLADKIIRLIIESLNAKDFNIKQKNLLVFNVLSLIEDSCNLFNDKEYIKSFIRHLENTTPKINRLINKINNLYNI